MVNHSGMMSNTGHFLSVASSERDNFLSLATTNSRSLNQRTWPAVNVMFMLLMH
uniref:Uncharacterized protein n=1 Tax=Arundo donax TaxID=35708 RepID=A0A0A9CFQ4_ARUDO